MQHREVPLTPDAHEALLQQREAFIEKFGREPGPDDPVFFDPDADTPQPLDLERYEKDLADAMAVAQRRSRVCGLTRLWAAAIRGFRLGFVVDPLARSAAVLCKSFVLSSLPIRKALVFLFFWGGVSALRFRWFRFCFQ